MVAFLLSIPLWLLLFFFLFLALIRPYTSRDYRRELMDKEDKRFADEITRMSDYDLLCWAQMGRYGGGSDSSKRHIKMAWDAAIRRGLDPSKPLTFREQGAPVLPSPTTHAWVPTHLSRSKNGLARLVRGHYRRR
jgi:hypothetical protein